LRGDLVGHTQRIHQQYVIKQEKSNHTILATTSTTKNPKRNPKRLLSKTSWADSDLWHLRMGHVGPTALAQLGNRTLGAKIRGPSTTKCPDCALAKIKQQISRRPDPNKSTIPFHKVYIDWFDLEHGWDSYQPEGRLIRRCLILTCEATGIALTYFITCSREDKNLPIL